MNFKPTKKKVKVSIIVTIAWILLIFIGTRYLMLYSDCICKDHPRSGCADELTLRVNLPFCHPCRCTTLTEITISNLKQILVPFLLVYIIWSLAEDKKKKKR